VIIQSGESKIDSIKIRNKRVPVLSPLRFGGVGGGFNCAEMKIKFNWGTGIVLALVIMMSGMLYLVSIALRQDYDLVDKDYYQKSITYQEHIEKVRNNDALTEKIRFEIAPESLKLTFPNLANIAEYSGEIHFYSPVEAKRDLTVNVKPDSTYMQTIDFATLQKGRYEVKIDWMVGKVSYYQEEEIILP